MLAFMLKADGNLDELPKNSEAMIKIMKLDKMRMKEPFSSSTVPFFRPSFSRAISPRVFLSLSFIERIKAIASQAVSKPLRTSIELHDDCMADDSDKSSLLFLLIALGRSSAAAFIFFCNLTNWLDNGIKEVKRTLHKNDSAFV